MKDTLARVFGDGGRIVTGVAPARVNMIGEHTDYNDGFVLPIAVDMKIEMAGRLRDDQTVAIYSADYDQTITFSVTNPIECGPGDHWSNYPKGVLWALQQEGIALKGMELAFGGDIPQGSGLSSSAALEIVTAIVLRALLGFEMEPCRLALLCQKAENDFVGTRCGIMDQFVSLMGRDGHAMFLDCRSLDFQQVPLKLGDHRILVCHSGVKRSLVSSEYNVRREQCEAGVGVLRRHLSDVRALRDVRLEQVELYRQELGPEIAKRCRHVVSENARVVESAVALRQGHLERFGQLMNASHDSQRDDYEISCPEIDLLVDLARAVPGVLGARMTGGGFGGCTVNLVSAGAIDRFSRGVMEEYRRRTKLEPRLYICSPSDGARIL